MKVICNRSDECNSSDCLHYGTHTPSRDCPEWCNWMREPVECIEDETSEVKPMPTRFWPAD